MSTTVNAGDEYKIIHQKSTAMKIAKIFFLVWTLLVVIPAVYFTFAHSAAIKEYAVVKAVYEADSILTEQYSGLADKVFSKINIDKYTAKITVPEIKLDSVSGAAAKTNAVASKLSKLGVKEAAKVEDTSAAVQKQADKINKQLQTSIDQIKTSLNKDIKAGLKKDLDELGGEQIRKQLALSDKAYKEMVSGKYGLMTEQERNTTARIYKELAQNKKGVFKDVISTIEHYYKWIAAALILLVLVLTLIPPAVVYKIAKKLSTTFTECPYCGKVFISKQNKLNILKLLKFW